MTVAEHQEKVAADLQQAQEQAQRFGQQATQWAQRVLYLQGQLDLLQQLDPEAAARVGVDPAVERTPMGPVERTAFSHAERRRQEKAAKANGAAVKG